MTDALVRLYLDHDHGPIVGSLAMIHDRRHPGEIYIDRSVPRWGDDTCPKAPNILLLLLFRYDQQIESLVRRQLPVFPLKPPSAAQDVALRRGLQLRRRRGP